MSMEDFSLQHIVDQFRFAEHMPELHQSLLTLGMLIIVAKLAEGVFRRLRLKRHHRLCGDRYVAGAGHGTDRRLVD